MLSVIQTAPTLDRAAGGTARAVAQLSDSLTEAGCRVALLHVEGRGEQMIRTRVTETCSAPAARLHGRSLWMHGYRSLLTRKIRERDARLLHDHGLWDQSHPQAQWAAQRCNVPLVLSPHGMLEPWALAHRRWRKQLALLLFQRRILESASMLWVTSEAEHQSVRRMGLRQPVAMVPNGVALPDFKARHDGHSAIRTALFVSRLHPVKGLLPFIEAWAQLRPQGWRMVVAGPDELGHRAQLEALIAQHGLQEAFEFTGEVAGERKRELFEHADLFVLPSRSENFGIAIAEALACGLPVLTTRGTPWKVLEDLGAGWRTGLSAEELREGLRSACATTSIQRAAMGAIGRRYVADTLGWPRIANLSVLAYQWLLERSSPRPGHVHLD